MSLSPILMMSTSNPITSRTRDERRLLLEAGLVSVAARLALAVLRFTTVQRWAARRPVSQPRTRPVERDRIVRAVNSVTRRLLPDRRCLLRGLVIQWMLRRAGQPAELRIGAARSSDGGLIAHAWVEQDGEVVAGGKDSPLIYRSFQTKNAAEWAA